MDIWLSWKEVLKLNIQHQNYVDLSDESDQADEVLALVTSGPVSAHTRSKCIGASRKGDGGTRPVGDDDSTIRG